MTTKTNPARSMVALTKSDVTDYSANPYRTLYVGTGGNVALMHVDDETAFTYKNVPDGSYIYAEFTQLLSTGTTAADFGGAH